MNIFSNNGDIDPTLWSTFGISVKENSDCIGKFGTGLKYAIAVLLREGREITIKTGGEVYSFSTSEQTIKDKTFNRVMCNDQEMPFTTHLGSGWELWQAYREIYSNCIDEGGWLGTGGDTEITADFTGVDHNDVVLSDRRCLASTEWCDVYAGESKSLFYKGMKATKLQVPSLFTYNIKHAELTEDRTFKYACETDWAILRTLMASDCDEFITGFTLHTKNHHEKSITSIPSSLICSKMASILIGNFRKDSVYLQAAVFELGVKSLGAAQYEKITPTDRQAAIIKKAMDFCERIEYPVIYPIFVSRDLGGSILALADIKTKVIYLSDRVLDQGVKQVAATLIEENIHIEKHLQDNTYEMQSYLFDQIVTMGEKLTGEIL